MTDERKEYLKQYRKENLKRIPLEFRNDYYRRLKNVAELEDTTATKLIKALVDKELRKLEKKYGIDPDWEVIVFTDSVGVKRYRRLFKKQDEY